MNQTIQPGILAEVPRLARYLFFSLKSGTKATPSLLKLAEETNGDTAVVGLGQSLMMALGKPVDGLKTFPAYTGPGFSVPSTPAALWIWLRGDDNGELLHLSRRLEQLLSPAFELDKVVDAFRYRDSRDLTGYEDGTENPQGIDAVNAAIVQQNEKGLQGSSFVAVQQWVHDIDHFGALPQAEQDYTIGRRLSDNEELDDAPESAHVKRTAQEDFDPEAFLVRRSMPWVNGNVGGLVFVAFGHSLDAFEAQLRKMVGEVDGITDALFNFTQPVSGSYFWCPPMNEGRLDLSMLGL